MVKEIGIDGVTIRDGSLVVTLKAKTAKGIVGLNVAFEVRREPEIIKAIDSLEDAINAALGSTLGLSSSSGQIEEPSLGATA